VGRKIKNGGIEWGGQSRGEIHLPSLVKLDTQSRALCSVLPPLDGMRGPNPDWGGTARGRGRAIPEDASAATTTAAAAAILEMPVSKQFQVGKPIMQRPSPAVRRDGTCYGFLGLKEGGRRGEMETNLSSGFVRRCTAIVISNENASAPSDARAKGRKQSREGVNSAPLDLA
jgi:hypothetical protein